ncbi:MAG: tetratricopeptide repeat protein [Planctomycetota bacterium]|nr:tetratricopeptide repeat protein [Planctomycetota bacterium]
MPALSSSSVGESIESPPRPESSYAPAKTPRPGVTAAMVLLGLPLLTFAVFLPALACGFINYDDGVYIWDNRFVIAGLTPKSIHWAFTTNFQSNWHPLTWLSLMLDAELFGMKPAGFHFTNLLLHSANVAMLALGLRAMTGSLWRSALAAALFAVHPLRVESVVWASERKDVLSTALGLLALLAYVRFARAPSWRRMALVVLPYALSLAAKPMLVSFPLLLLLLDCWPMRRWREAGSPDELPTFPRTPPRLLFLEKLPLFALALASCVVTIIAANQGDTFRPLSQFGLGARLGNAMVSTATYVGTTLWPHDLALLYPWAPYQPMPKVALAAGVMLTITLGTLLLARRRPQAAVGWLWFLIALLPVVGILHVGRQSMADRYTYVPGIGLAIAFAWLLPEAGRSRAFRAATVVGCLAILTAMVAATRLQITHWRDAATIARRTLSLTHDNYMVHTLLGSALLREGKYTDAADQLRIALQLQPGYAVAHSNLADAEMALDARDSKGLVELHLRRAMQLQPDNLRYLGSLADLKVYQGQFDEAEAHYRRALAIDPTYAEAANNLAVLLEKRGRAAEAIPFYELSLRHEPRYASAHGNFGLLLLRLGRYDEAIAHFKAVLEVEPGDAVTRKRIGLAEELKHAPATTEPGGPEGNPG